MKEKSSLDKVCGALRKEIVATRHSRRLSHLSQLTQLHILFVLLRQMNEMYPSELHWCAIVDI